MNVCGDKYGAVPLQSEQTDVTEQPQQVNRAMKKKSCKGKKR